MDPKIKVLVCGDVEGKFNMLFNKIENINKKSGPFDLLLCVGNFFGINNSEYMPYLNGSKKIPIPTYILGPNNEDHYKLYPSEESDVCENLYYLGKRGIYTVSGGLKIAYLSGTLVSDGGKPEPFNYTTDDVIELKDICLRNNVNYKGVDILLTSQWPQGVTSKSKNELSGFNYATTQSAWLAYHLKPRYHFSGLEGIYYERPPYRNTLNGDFGITTRFIGLARVGNPKKEKWIYAASLTPLEKMKISDLLQKTTDETDIPYNLSELDAQIYGKKSKPTAQNQFFYDMSASHEEQGHKKAKRQRIEFDQSKCWFCLASPSVEKHLVVTVGNAAYLAAAKGGLVDEHLLICPIEHHQSAVGLAEDISEEIEKFKEALRKFYARNGKVAVFFERNYKTSHMQIQCVPIPQQATKELKEIFLEEAQGNDIELMELEAGMRLDQVVQAKSPYFALELPNREILYTKIKGSKGFPINFAREVLALGPVLNMPDRIEWKDCTVTKEKEIKMINQIRTDFEPYDITD